MKKKYALVLGGGGARGAYQIGAWRAFRELGIKFDCIVGVSVGALNGILMLQNLFNEAVEIWNNISLEKIVYIPDGFVYEMKKGPLQLFSSNFFKAILNVWDDIKKHKGLDSSPLYNLILKYTNERKARSLKVDFGLVTFRVDDLAPQVLFLEDIPLGMLPDYLLASASLPGFKPARIANKSFIDGGVYNNVPYNIVKKRGHRKIIVVDISGPGLKESPQIENTEVIYIKNSIDFGSLLDFRPAVIKDFMLLGYLDTMKTFQKIDGIYYFYRINRSLLDKMEKYFYSFENKRKMLEILKSTGDKSFTEAIRSILPEEVKYYRYISIALLEQAARFLGVPILKLYAFKDLVIQTYNGLNTKKKEDPELFGFRPKNIFEEIIKSEKLQKSLILNLCLEFFKGLKF
ncbi:MAG: patatin-like phospholipase family protein [Brevinematia bacterium]